MWKAFLKKEQIKTVPDSLGVVVSVIAEFLSEPIVAITSKKELSSFWHAPGPWVKR